MNSRQSWLFSCLSEKNCRRCMYHRYARAMRTLRAAAALLALHADELADPCIKPPEALSFLPNPHTGLAFLFDVLAVVFVLADEPICARAKLLFLRGVVCLWRLPLLFASSAACLWRLPLLFASSAASSKCAWRGQGRGQEAMACAILSLQKLRVTKQFALSLILICCGRHAASRPAVRARTIRIKK